MTQCECLVAGWCERHQINKSQMLHHKCQHDIDFWQAWEKGRGPKQKNPNKVKVCKIPGPGDFLARELYQRGYKVKRGCGCQDKVSEMNRWGLAECRRRIDTIEKWLRLSAKKYSWAVTIGIYTPILRQVIFSNIREIITTSLDKYEKWVNEQADNKMGSCSNHCSKDRPNDSPVLSVTD